MKKVLSVVLIALLCVCLCLQALGAGGSSSDPVVSLSYLNSTVRPALLEEAGTQVDRQQAQEEGAAFEAFAELAATQNETRAKADQTARQTQGKLLLKSGDRLTLAPGTQVTLLYGAASSDCANLINISAASRLGANAALQARICYMKDNAATGGIVITSQTAEVYVDGVYTLQYAAGINYASLADALYEMKLFAGMSGTISGYGLEQSCTRIEALVMFLRLIGVQAEASVYTGTHPFTDVPSSHWGYPYLAYAYANGLTYGTTATTFSPSTPVNMKAYLTFLLRALHYDEGSDFSYDNAVQDAVKLGLFSQTELNRLSSSTFLRAQMVYLSYYALYGTEQTTGGTLLQQLIAGGDVSYDQAVAGACKVYGARIS